MRRVPILIAVACFGFGAIVAGGTEQPDKPVVVFDFGGVMAEFDLRQMFEYGADAFDMSPNEFKQAIKKDIGRLTIGDIEEEEYWIQLANSNSVSLPFQWKEQYRVFIKELVCPRREMYAFLSELKTDGYRVALFSDVTAWQAEAFRELGLYQGFSPIMLSCETGTRKPRLEAYWILLKELGVEPEQCIFVDDRPENIEAARAIGIRGIIFTCFEEMRSAIEEELTKMGSQNEVRPDIRTFGVAQSPL